MVEHKNNCLVCGSELVYSDIARPLGCAYCGKTFESNAACAQGHYVCDACHSLSATDLIREFCLESDSTDPLEMAVTLMQHPSVKMHGPEHHFLVPAVLLAAYYNLKGDTESKAIKIKEAEKRSKHILGGFCGLYGNCGAGVGTGIFLSLITDTTPLSEDTWGLCNLLTSRSLLAIAENGGPRCCKRDSFLAIIEAVRFLEEKMGVTLPTHTDIACQFSALNKECRKSQCPFHPSASRAGKGDQT